MEDRQTVFVTGFPGYLASALLPGILEAREPNETVTCLVQPAYESLALQKVRAFPAADAARVRVLTGDITSADVGLGERVAAVRRSCVEVFHLAAVYDLAVSEKLATAVNVDGTRNVLRLASDTGRLRRFHHISTCYVSGRFDGLFLEEDLDRGQPFGNHYEETKFRSEQLVRKAAEAGLPTTIYRPSIVGGDSRTGAAEKLDGPFHFIRWLRAQPRVAIMPRFARSESTFVNIVPSDFVVRSIAYLSRLGHSNGKTYQLCDPDPLVLQDFVRALAEATDRRVLSIRCPRKAARFLVRAASRIHPRLDIPSEAVDYLDHPTRYSARNTTEDLAGTGIKCPPVTSYLGAMADFEREHPETRSAAMH